MSGDEWHGNCPRAYGHMEYRKTLKRPYLYENERSEPSCKKHAHGRNYSMCIGQQNGDRGGAGGQFGYGRDRQFSDFDRKEFYGNRRECSKEHSNYINASGNFDKIGNINFGRRSHKGMEDGNYGTAGNDSSSEKESVDSGKWSYWSSKDETPTVVNEHKHNWRWGDSWRLKGKGYRSAKGRYKGRGIGHQEKSPLDMTLKEKIYKFGVFLKNDIPKANAIQTLEIGLARCGLGLKINYNVNENKTVSGKPLFTGVLKLSGVFMGKSSGFTKKETKHKVYETALENLTQKSVDEIFQLKDPVIEAERNEEAVSLESGGYNTNVLINADSVQTGENNTQIINIPPGQPVNIDQRGNANKVFVNIKVNQERRPSDSVRGPDRYIDLKIQMSRQDGLTVVHAEDLENLGLEALKTEEGKLIIQSIETALDAKTNSIFKGSIIIRLRQNKDSISKLKSAIESEQLHKILARIVELDKVLLSVLGSYLILNVTACIPMEDFIEEDKCFTEKGSICIRFKSSSEDVYSRLKTKVENGQLQRILASISEIEPVHSALSGSDLVMNVTASVTEGNERPLSSDACTWKSQDQVKLLENDSSNISPNFLPDTSPCTLCKNRMKCLHNSVEAEPNTEFDSSDTSNLKSDPAPLENTFKDGISKLRDDLITAYSNLRCVQTFPIFEKIRCDIAKIYVDLVIEKKQHVRDTDETKSVSTLCKDVQPYNTEVINVTSYKQIFLDGRGSKFKRIYLLGKGGLGKTTFCRKIIHAWCNAHEGRAVAQGGSFQDEAVLQMFGLLFYMNLREVSFEKNLIEAIFAQLPVEKVPSKHILGSHLKFNGDKVLFILDGLDEMIVKSGFIENVVTRSLYPNCCFLVSSRPWKFFYMELQEGVEIDLLLDLKGFSQRNVQEFATKLFENCYNDGNAIKQFTEDIACNKLVTQLIHVPLLLLLLVQIWYENKRSLPNKLHELYIMFLDRMVDRILEKRKRDPNHRQMRFTVGDIQTPFPSKISRTSLAVNFGEGFLLSLCEVAHHFLLSSGKENSLIFKKTNLLNALGERGKEKLDMALDLGILSVTNSMFYLNRETSVSFLHETIQEFLTALYLIVKPEKLENFISSMADLNDVQQNENIIVFLVGLMPELGNRVLEKCNELCKDDLENLWSEEGMDRHRYRALDIINTMYLRCKREVLGEDVLLTVSRLCLDQNDFDLQCWNPALLQSLDLIGTRMSHVYVNLRGFTGLRYLRLHSLNCELYLPESDSISVLIMDTLKLFSSCCDVLGSTLTHCTKLERLCIHDTDLYHCVLDLSNMTELTVLDISGVTLSSSCCDVLGSTLTHCTKLERLCIHDTDLYHCVLDLCNMTELTVLDISGVILSSSCCDVLGSTLTHYTKLERLCIHDTDLYHYVLDLCNMTELTVLDISGVTLSSSCCDVLGSTLTHCTKLERLCIHDTDLYHCVLDLCNMTELTVLDISGVTLSSSCCDVLGSTLTHCTKLERLCIHDTDLYHCVLDLSNMTELTVLDISGVTLSSSCCDVLGNTLTHCTKLERLCIHDTDFHHCLLDLSNMTELTVLDISGVTLSSSCCDVLGSTLTHCTKLEKLCIHDTDLHHCVLDLSNMTELTVLDISGVTLSSSCCDVLGSTLTHCTKLERLCIHDTDLYHCVLDLSNMTELTVLDISRVTLSSSCCDVLGNTLTHCTKLERLCIHDTDFHHCLLDLSNMTELTVLDISGVTLSSSCCDVLGSTLTHCTKLERLCIHDTDFHHCLLDLSNTTELTVLDISGVTLSSSCCDVLGSTLTHCTKLERLCIHDTDLYHCVLDLCNMTELTVLDISRVTLSSSCCDVLGSTLTHCTKLEKLCIHDTDFHHCLLDLSNMTELTVLDISGVTLSSSCCDVLGSTLTHCTKLERLCIHDTDLYHCVLDLCNMTELTVLDISGVTLSSSCCDVLGSTLTHCTKLERLCIHDTDFHHCLLDLSNMTELTVLDISGVTLSSSCCDVLGSTLTHCTKLERLCIHDTDLYHCVLDLSNMTELTVLDISGVTLSSSCCDVLGSTLTHCTKLERLCIHDTDFHNCVLDLSNMRKLKFLDISGVTLSSSCCDVLGNTLGND